MQINPLLCIARTLSPIWKDKFSFIGNFCKGQVINLEICGCLGQEQDKKKGADAFIAKRVKINQRNTQKQSVERFSLFFAATAAQANPSKADFV